MRKIIWEISEEEVALYAKDVLEIELTDWQLLHVMDRIEVQLEKLVDKTIEDTISLED